MTQNTQRRNHIATPFDPKTGVCCYCGGPREKGRRRWCSAACVDDFLVRKGDAARIAYLVRQRDKEICQRCCCDTKAVLRVLLMAVKAIQETGIGPAWNAKPQVWRLFGIPEYRERLWDADHIVPVVEGGGGCGLDNYRTLCIWCHRDVTAELAARRAVNRRDAGRALLS